jgi:NitT/TauT family transport system permease protein
VGNDKGLIIIEKINNSKLATVKVATKLSEIIQFLFPFIVLGCLWEALIRLDVVNAKLLPAPSMLVQEIYELLFRKHTLQYHLYHSLYRLFLGYLLAVIVGVAMGTVLALRKVARQMFSLTLSLLLSIPTIAWIPVLLITMGLGDKTVITAIFLGGVFEITYSTVVGMRSVDRQLINAARIMSATRWALFFKVLLPGSLVFIMPALRLSIGYCWRALVAGEMLSAMIKWGLGKMIYEARFWNDVKVMLVGLVAIGVLGVLLDRLILKTLEKATLEKWGMLVER